MSTNRQINIYVNAKDGEEALKRFTTQNEKLNASVTKNQAALDKMTAKLESSNLSKTSAEYKKLQQSIETKSAAVQRDTERIRANNDEMSRITKKINGELSPSYNDLRKNVTKLTQDLKRMSEQDLGFNAKIKELQSATKAMRDFDNKLKGSENAATKMTAGISSASVAAGVLIANAATAALTWMKEEILAGVEAAKTLEGVKVAFDRLNNPALLDDMRKATRGTVTDLELMKQAVMANNFQIPLNQLADLFQFASQRAKDTGQDVDYLVNSIITGIGRKSPLILDNLGISAVRLKSHLHEATVEASSIGDVAKAVGEIIREENAKSGASTQYLADKSKASRAEWENIRNEFSKRLLPAVVSVENSFFRLMTTIVKVSGGILDFLGVKKELGSIDTAYQFKQEADSAQKLLTRYEELKEKGIKATAKEKAEMTSITYTLKNALGDSVTAINKETGALELNIQATKDSIKQKILLSNQQLSAAALEYTNAKEQKAMAEAQLQTINESRKLSRDATLGDITNAEVRAKIANEDESTFLRLKSLREAANQQSKAILESNKKMYESMQLLKKYGFSDKEADINEWAKKSYANGMSTPSDAPAKDEKDKDKLKSQQEAFSKKMQELRREQLIALSTDDKKELESVQHKYNEIKSELEKAYPHMIGKYKQYYDEIEKLRKKDEASTEEKIKYAGAIKFAENYYDFVKSEAKQSYADGIIDKKEYDQKIKDLDKELIQSKINISGQFELSVKSAGIDKVQFEKTLNDKIVEDKISANEKMLESWKDAQKKALEVSHENAKKQKEIDDRLAKEKKEGLMNTMNNGFQIFQGFLQLMNSSADVDMRRESIANDKKKKEYKKMLDSKRISQKRYDELVERADEESAKKQSEIRKKQFEVDRIARLAQITMDTAVAVMRVTAQEAIAAPLLIPSIIALGATQAGIVAATAPPEFGGGGIYDHRGVLSGPSHAQGGLGLYNEVTGQKVAEFEGGEPYMILSDKFRQNNADIIPTILDASRTGERLIDRIFSNKLLSVSPSRVIETVRYQTGGIYTPPSYSTSTPTSSTVSSRQDISVSPQDSPSYFNDAVQMILSILQSIERNTKQGIDYDELTKRLNYWMKQIDRRF